MGKAARLKDQRRLDATKPPPVGKYRPRAERMKLIWAGTGGLIVVIATVVGVLIATRSSPKPPPPAAASAADRDAPASLVKAADAVNFHPTTEPGVGEIETQPATAAGVTTNPDLLAVGSKAPAFTLQTPQGRQVSLADYRGKAVLLEFFATWCPHCNAEAPHLEKLAASLPKRTTALLSVNADGEDAGSVFAFHRYYGLQYPALLDPSSQPGSFNKQGGPGSVSAAYSANSYPTFYVIGPQGRVAWSSDGEQPDALLRQQVLKAAASA